MRPGAAGCRAPLGHRWQGRAHRTVAHKTIARMPANRMPANRKAAAGSAADRRTVDETIAKPLAAPSAAAIHSRAEGVTDTDRPAHVGSAVHGSACSDPVGTMTNGRDPASPPPPAEPPAPISPPPTTDRTASNNSESNEPRPWS